MKNNTFKNAITSMLSVCILLLLSSQAVYAVKPDKAPPAPTTVIHSVVVDIASNTIVVTGDKFTTIAEVTLGEYTIDFTSTSVSTGVINFADIDAAVTGVLTAGNYSLVVGDNMSSIYLSPADATAITSPDPVDYTACPCHADWKQFGTNYTDPYSGNPYLGFEGATAYTSTITTEQTEVKIITDDLEHWTLNTQFDGTAGTCGTPDPTFDFELDVTNQTAYEACASYLQATYL